MHAPSTERGPDFIDAMLDELVRHGRALHVIHLLGRLIRNLAVDELIIAGDLWDRGPRGDRVMDYLRLQPNFEFIWGNHDVSWLVHRWTRGANLHCTKNLAALSPSQPARRRIQCSADSIEHLAQTVYANDPAEYFMPKEDGLRPNVLVARMQKAAAIMQFKLEGQVIDRNPQWGLNHRRLLHRIDYLNGNIEIDGQTYALRDRHFPTIDPQNPYVLSTAETSCLERLKHSFLNSQKLKEQMRVLVGYGSCICGATIASFFHGCVPPTQRGIFFHCRSMGRCWLGERCSKRLRRLFDAPLLIQIKPISIFCGICGVVPLAFVRQRPNRHPGTRFYRRQVFSS